MLYTAELALELVSQAMNTYSMVLALSEQLNNANPTIPVKVRFEMEYSRRGYLDLRISPWPGIWTIIRSRRTLT